MRVGVNTLWYLMATGLQTTYANFNNWLDDNDRTRPNWRESQDRSPAGGSALEDGGGVGGIGEVASQHPFNLVKRTIYVACRSLHCGKHGNCSVDRNGHVGCRCSSNEASYVWGGETCDVQGEVLPIHSTYIIGLGMGIIVALLITVILLVANAYFGCRKKRGLPRNNDNSRNEGEEEDATGTQARNRQHSSVPNQPQHAALTTSGTPSSQQEETSFIVNPLDQLPAYYDAVQSAAPPILAGSEPSTYATRMGLPSTIRDPPGTATTSFVRNFFEPSDDDDDNSSSLPSFSASSTSLDSQSFYASSIVSHASSDTTEITVESARLYRNRALALSNWWEEERERKTFLDGRKYLHHRRFSRQTSRQRTDSDSDSNGGECHTRPARNDLGPFTLPRMCSQHLLRADSEHREYCGYVDCRSCSSLACEDILSQLSDTYHNRPMSGTALVVEDARSGDDASTAVADEADDVFPPLPRKTVVETSSSASSASSCNTVKHYITSKSDLPRMNTTFKGGEKTTSGATTRTYPTPRVCATTSANFPLPSNDCITEAGKAEAATDVNVKNLQRRIRRRRHVDPDEEKQKTYRVVLMGSLGPQPVFLYEPWRSNNDNYHRPAPYGYVTDRRRVTNRHSNNGDNIFGDDGNGNDGDGDGEDKESSNDSSSGCSTKTLVALDSPLNQTFAIDDDDANTAAPPRGTRQGEIADSAEGGPVQNITDSSNLRSTNLVSLNESGRAGNCEAKGKNAAEQSNVPSPRNYSLSLDGDRGDRKTKRDINPPIDSENIHQAWGHQKDNNTTFKTLHADSERSDKTKHKEHEHQTLKGKNEEDHIPNRNELHEEMANGNNVLPSKCEGGTFHNEQRKESSNRKINTHAVTAARQNTHNNGTYMAVSTKRKLLQDLLETESSNDAKKPEQSRTVQELFKTNQQYEDAKNPEHHEGATISERCTGCLGKQFRSLHYGTFCQHGQNRSFRGKNEFSAFAIRNSTIISGHVNAKNSTIETRASKKSSASF